MEMPSYGETNITSRVETDSTIVYAFLDFEPDKDDTVEIDGKLYRISAFSKTLAGYQLKLSDNRPNYHHTQGRFR
ncbi:MULTISPECIES: hypothetical protein [unclassified Nitratiruptor]|uniref:hypothetical protein n=1 Tax=unclassified Nitratiruptor TaxID=2624044 RepID=UPI001915F64A|nr:MULTISPECIES: hypothetical protein [unclassified Nitratiruptor]